MRRSIRNQILIPLAVIQVAAVCAITLTAAGLAARRSERQVIDRLDGVIGTLGQASNRRSSSQARPRPAHRSVSCVIQRPKSPKQSPSSGRGTAADHEQYCRCTSYGYAITAIDFGP